MPKGRVESVELPTKAVVWEALGAVERLAADAARTDALVRAVDSEEVVAAAADDSRIAVAVVVDKLEAVTSNRLKAGVAALGLW